MLRISYIKCNGCEEFVVCCLRKTSSARIEMNALDGHNFYGILLI